MSYRKNDKYNWWLRSTNLNNSMHVAIVDENGSINSFGEYAFVVIVVYVLLFG